MVKEVLDGAETLTVNSIEGKARLCGLTEDEIDPQIAKGRIGEKRKDLVAKLTPHAIKEWGLDPNLSPTVAIGLVMLPWSFGAGTAFLTLSSLAKQKAARDAKAKEKETKSSPV